MLYKIGRGLLRLLFMFTGGITYSGIENVPKTGGLIIAPNHISFADPPVAGIGLYRQVHFMAKEELFRPPVFGSILRRIGTFPVRRGSADRRAIKRAIELLTEGRVVCIFPEGTRSLNGKLGDPEVGVGLIAIKSRAPVVPVAIKGTERVLPAHAKRLHRHRIHVTYGKPITFDDLYEMDNRQAMEEAGRRIMSAIADLLG